ncbi:hypothetical protein G6F44_012716 [Rhizopus delemar]|nr:hypothetical protein G6F44_012716 [Rhizopus delemar]
MQSGCYIPFHEPPSVTSTPTPTVSFSTEQSHLIDQAIQGLLVKAAIEKVSAQQVQQTPGFYSLISSSFQDGNNQRRIANDKAKRLPSLNRFIGCLSSYSSPPRLFTVSTAEMKEPSVPILPILEHFYSQSFRISAYLDDWILAASTKQLAIQQVLAVVALLQQLGWMVNFKKSILTPTQQLGHLGFVSNTSTMTASLPMKKLRDIRRSIKQALDHPHRQSTRVVHSLTMRIQAATFAIFPARLYTRHLLYYKNQTVKSEKDWDLPSSLDPVSIHELNWWYHSLQKWNGRSLLPSFYWTPIEAAQLINWQEFKAAHLALKIFRVPKNSTILIRTNDTASLSYINKQGETHSRYWN